MKKLFIGISVLGALAATAAFADPLGKVLVLHNENVIEVSCNALDAHLDHGDKQLTRCRR